MQVPRLQFAIVSLLILNLKSTASYGFGIDPDLHSPSPALSVKNNTCKTLEGQFNSTFYSSIKSGSTLLLHYGVDLASLRNPRNLNIRAKAAVGSSASPHACPVIFVIGQLRFITSMELPFRFEPDDTVYREAARTLCVPMDTDPSYLRNITVQISTCSEVPINFSFQMSKEENYILPKDKLISFEVLPTTPVIHSFLFSPGDGVTSVKLTAESKDNKCMTVSVQPLSCPVYFYDANVRFKGLWQTMTQKAAITIENTGRFVDGFTLVLVAHEDDERCGKPKDPLIFQQLSGSRATSEPVSKKVKIKLNSDSRIPSLMLLICTSIPVLLCFAVILATLVMFRFRHVWITKEAVKTDVTDSFALRNMTSPGANLVHANGGLIDNFSLPVDRSSGVYHNFLPLPSPTSRPQSSAVGDAAMPLQDYQNSSATSLGSAVDRKSKVLWKADLHLEAFSVGKPRIVHDRHAKKFCWALITVAIFYTIPVYQLLFHYLRVLYRTGEYDTCYYNYLCAYRVGYLLDFNHFFSNIGYIIFGAAFMFIVRRREVNLVCPKPKHRLRNLSRPESVMQLSTKNAKPSGKCDLCFPSVETHENCGVFPHYGVHYALGLALIMEGFLSAAYHVCPNQTSFQFDTCFMYVISLLTILKIYQFRHPMSLDSHETFGILAGLILTSVAGLILEYGNSDSVAYNVFWILFIICQFSTLMVAFIYYYTLGYIMDYDGTVLTSLSILRRIKALRVCSFRFDRLLFPLISMLLCIGVVVYASMNDLPFATYLLYTFIANVLGSCLYYILIMKPLHGEFKNYTWIQPTLYFVAAGVVGGFAMHYFVQSPAMWEKSAAQSRSENNMPCLTTWFPFQPFYDVHDVWHFYSAAALFLAFMGLLVVDDDLIAVPRNRIPVF